MINNKQKALRLQSSLWEAPQHNKVRAWAGIWPPGLLAGPSAPKSPVWVDVAEGGKGQWPRGERRAAPTSAWSFYFLPTEVAPQLQVKLCLCALLQLGGLTAMLLLHFPDRDRLRGVK